MNKTTLSLLKCPFCGGVLKPSHNSNYEQDFSVLTCFCGQFPVISGIPILKKGKIGAAGQPVDHVVNLIKKAHYKDALLAMILPAPAAPKLAPRWVNALPQITGLNRIKNFMHHKKSIVWKKQMADFLTKPKDQLLACDLFDAHFRQSCLDMNDAYDYFTFRFGQPRHIVALSFATLVNQPQKPVLELACGFGHITRSLVGGAGMQPVIGVDRNFFTLYVAKNWVAPEAKFVCCEADISLPFPDNTFSSIFCVDGLHYFLNKVGTTDKMSRLIDENGAIILAATRNANFKHPHAGTPLSPAGYQNLVKNLPHRLIADNTVLDRYLKKAGPPLSQSSPMEQLEKAPLISIIVSNQEKHFINHGPFNKWPHSHGTLKLNPLYKISSHENSREITLQRKFPSTFYENENIESKKYLPESITIESSLMDKLNINPRLPEVERLIDQFVVMGMPEKYI